MKKQCTKLAVIATVLLCATCTLSFKSPGPDNTAPKPPVYIYKQITAVESVIAGGIGRSRLLTTDGNGQMIEGDLKNFYSMVGINFENIANNDRTVVDKLNEYSEQGWELVQVTTGNNQQSSGGLFITRYIFKKLK